MYLEQDFAIPVVETFLVLNLSCLIDSQRSFNHLCPPVDATFEDVPLAMLSNVLCSKILGKVQNTDADFTIQVLFGRSLAYP